MIIILSTIIPTVVVILIAGFVLKKSLYPFAAKSFFAFSLILASWMVANYFSVAFLEKEFGIWLVRFVMVLAVYLTASFWFFVRSFLQRVLLKSKFLWMLGIVSTIVALFCLTPLVFEGVRDTGSGLAPQASFGIVIFGVTVTSFILAAVSQVLNKYRHASGIHKLQIGYIGLGMACMLLLMFTFNFVFVVVQGNTRFVQYGGLFTLPFVTTTAYVLLKYRFLDIRIVIRKSLVQFTTFVLLFAIYAYALLLVQKSTSSTFTLSSNTSLLVTIFVIGLTIEPLRKGIYTFIDGIVANRERDRQEALKRMQLMSTSTMKFQTLLERTQQELGNTFGVQVDFLLAERRVRALTQFPSGHLNVHLEDQVGIRIASGRLLIADELPYRVEDGESSLTVIHDWMQAKDVSAIVPIGAGEDMVGAFLFRGMGKVVYTADMVRFMKDFQEQSTFAFASAYAYKLAVERIGK